MENEMDTLLAILVLKPLLEYFWVFSNPVKILQWILPSNYRTQRVLFLSSMPKCTKSPCLPGRVPSFHRTFSSSVLLCTYALRSMPIWQSSHIILSDSGSSLKLSAEFLPLCTPVHTLNAHLAELYIILHDSVCNFVSATQPCLLRCSVTSKVFLLSR
jgi:hypothetical protein